MSNAVIANPPKPTALRVIPENVPIELRNSTQCVVWEYVWNTKKNAGAGGWDKPPKQRNGKLASSKKPATWCSFDEALAEYKSGTFAGIGHCLTTDGGIVGIDLDHCRDPATGEIDEQAQHIITTAASYTEISPSGTGIRIFAKGQLPNGTKVDRDRNLEFYDAAEGRYVTITGHRLDDSPETIEERTTELAALIAELFPDVPRQETQPKRDKVASNFPELTHAEIESALAALPAKLADDTESWSGIGHALYRHDASVAMLAIWDHWSSQSPKYQSNECARRWGRMGGPPAGNGRSPMTVDTIFYQARQAGWRPERPTDSVVTVTTAGDKPVGVAVATIGICAPTEISNGIWTGQGEDRKVVPLTMREVLHNFRVITGDWPRRVGGALFVDTGGDVSWLDSTAALIGWAASTHGRIYWHRGTGFVTKEETYAEQQRTATCYDAVELIPHVPLTSRAYYVGGMPEPGDGTALTELLSRFCPASDIDGDLILAMFATAIYGGPPGSRPAFVITADKGRGIGKTKLPTMLSHVTGGLLDFSANEDIGSIKARLLSADAAGTRIALLDNVKSLRFSWAELEALITAPVISGKRMYVGEASRPNTLLWVVTLNGASLSTDMAQRSVIIKLAPPKRSASWEEDTTAFIIENRDRIIADLVGFYRRPKALTQSTRWAAWEGEVLARLAEPDEAQHVILERQGEADAEAEESGIIEDYFAKQISDLNYDVDGERIHMPSEVVARWYNAATNENRGVTGAVRMLKQLHSEGRIKRLQPNPCKSYGRGFLWVGAKADAAVVVRSDIEERITNATQIRYSRRT